MSHITQRDYTRIAAALTNRPRNQLSARLTERGRRFPRLLRWRVVGI